MFDSRSFRGRTLSISVKNTVDSRSTSRRLGHNRLVRQRQRYSAPSDPVLRVSISPLTTISYSRSGVSRSTDVIANRSVTRFQRFRIRTSLNSMLTLRRGSTVSLDSERYRRQFSVKTSIESRPSDAYGFSDHPDTFRDQFDSAFLDSGPELLRDLIRGRLTVAQTLGLEYARNTNYDKLPNRD